MLQKPIVKVVIVSKTNDLENKLDNFSNDKEMKVIVMTCESFDDQLLNAGDLIFIDGIVEDIQSIKNEGIVKGRSCIFYGSNEDIERLNDELDLLSYFDDLWSKSSNDTVLSFWYSQLINKLNTNKDTENTHIFLNALMNNTDDFIWIKDLRGVHLKVNESFGRLVDKSVSECVGRGHYYIWDLEPDEYADGEYVCLETDEEVVRVKERMLFEEKIKAHNQTYLLETYKSPLINSKGELIGTVGSARDITSERNLLKIIEEIMNTNLIGILIADKNKTVDYYNRLFEETIGKTKHEIKGMKMDEVVGMLKSTNVSMTSQELDLHDVFGDVLAFAYLFKIDTKENK